MLPLQAADQPRNPFRMRPPDGFSATVFCRGARFLAARPDEGAARHHSGDYRGRCALMSTPAVVTKYFASMPGFSQGGKASVPRK